MLITTAYTAPPPHSTFLYPGYRRYPFDEVCEKIVRALEKRNWKVPGIRVQFVVEGTGEEKYRHVSKIQAEDFKLWFIQTRIYEIVIPKRELQVYEDESGPTYFTYVGDNWEKDKKSFMNECKLANRSKLNGEPRTYLKYTGASSLDGSYSYYSHRRNPYLVNDDDSGSEYKACEGEPKYFDTEQVFQEVNEWLNENPLQRIESVKEATSVELTAEPEIPYPEHIGPFYVKIDGKEYDRIIKGKEDKNQLEPSERYALLGIGKRLVDLDVSNDGLIPEEAYDGFKYCSLKKPEFEENDRCVVVLRIHPKNANHIFVADYTPGAKYAGQCYEKRPNTIRMLTEEEHKEYQRLVGKTMVPIHRYEGNYEIPVVLIGSSRELSFDEVEIVDMKEKDSPKCSEGTSSHSLCLIS